MSVRPTVGRIVHYVAASPPACRPALVTRIDSRGVGQDDADLLTLTVFGVDSITFVRVVPYDEGAGEVGDPGCPNSSVHGNPMRYCGCGWTEPTLRPGTWHWQERG